MLIGDTLFSESDLVGEMDFTWFTTLIILKRWDFEVRNENDSRKWKENKDNEMLIDRDSKTELGVNFSKRIEENWE